MSQVCFRLTCGCMSLIIYYSLIGVGTVMILISSRDLLTQDLCQGGPFLGLCWVGMMREWPLPSSFEYILLLFCRLSHHLSY